MAPLKTTYKSDFVRPKIHHYSSVPKLKKKKVKFAGDDKDVERMNKCLAQKYVKIPETIDLYPFVKICSYENIKSNEKTTYQDDFPDANPVVSRRLIKEFDHNTDPCRFLYDPVRYPRLASDVTHSRNSTKPIFKDRYPRYYTDITEEKSPDKQMNKKIINISRHLFDRSKKSFISDALPGGKCIGTTTEYQDGIGTFRGEMHKIKPNPVFKCTGHRICKTENECD